MICHLAKLLYDAKATLGEGPVWDHRKNLLLWVDIENGTLYTYDPVKGSHHQRNFGEMLGAAVPAENGQLLLALASGLALYDPVSEIIERSPALSESGAEIRCNDGKCDFKGNFWIGTMHRDLVPYAGGLYKITGDFSVSLQLPDTSVSNGMAWSADNRTYYYIDSGVNEVAAFDFDPERCTISGKRRLFRFPENYGSADGMCIDTEGMLWIAHWGGKCVRRWHPHEGRVVEMIDVPAPHTTSCCFGGEAMDTLYITTARSGLPQEQLLEYPMSGGIFTCRPGSRGTPITYFMQKECATQE